MNEDTTPVRIKGIGNRLWLTVSASDSYELIQTELARILDPLKHQTRGARVVLDIGAAPGDHALSDRISRYLKDEFQFDAIESPPEKNTSVETYSEMQNERPSTITRRPGDTVVMAGRVRSGQTVTAKNHLIIMGDVNPGSEITAGGDILVLGSLCGTAAAGQPGNADAIIMALDFRPIQIKIGALVAAGLPESGSASAEFAHVEGGAIIVEDYLAANPFKRLSWPVIR